ncbi:MAG: amidohydrolase family protein, partial [Halobacteriales archaeon]|nr:amidohydrolase family protein [Halobacteriales archaeon]
MATKQEVKELTIADLTIVDADSHTGPDRKEDLLPYIDERNAARRMIETATDPGSEIFTHTRASPAFPNDGDYEGGRAGYDPNDPEGKLGFMREFGVDYSVITPFGGIATINHDQTAVAIMRAYNEWLADNWFDVDDGIKVAIVATNHRPEMAAEEIDRWGDEDDVVAVQFPGAGLVPPAGHYSYEPVYEAALDHDLPIAMHSHDIQAAQIFPIQRMWAETFTESHAFSFPVEHMWHVISLVCNGVPEKYPDLEWVFQEPGFEWVPWMMWRLDDHYYQNSQDLPMLTKPPSEYIRDQFHFTTQPLGHTDDPGQMASMMELAGGRDTILFSTDH